MEGRLPAEGFEQLRLKSRPELTSASLLRVGSNVYSTVQQQDYSASVWLRKKDKLEHSQQKCIVVFALVCCFAVLVALIFSAVDIWGEDEDGITEDNCSKNCRIVLVENIPEDLSYTDNGTAHLSLYQGLLSLLDSAEKTVEIVSSHWALNNVDLEQGHPSTWQSKQLFKRICGLQSQDKSLKIASDLKQKDSKELKDLEASGADIHFLNMTALTRGNLRSSFWVVDKKHMYIGSASMEWHSMAQMKELGVIIYNCSCLALDLHRIFTLYWQLEYKDFVPAKWSKRVFALSSKVEPLKLHLNNSKAEAFLSSSPSIFCPNDRTKDIDAINRVISDAKRFIYVSIMDYLPLVNIGSHSSGSTQPNRYWSRIDEMLREALLLHNIKVRLLISCWKQTHPLTFNFVWSLKTLCTEIPDCSLEVKFFCMTEQNNASFPKINRNKFMVTDRAVYIGNNDWIGNDFTYNAGVGLVISQAEVLSNSTIVEQLKAVFEQDWYSWHAKSLQANEIPECIKHKINHTAGLKVP
ncbi:inactive phospholipase D5-like [Polyodon spathula]|uniref:inactive phospholipase D5-like n=1 Tax=Polyodon spathula TaxID=7913 RepID=UPI001B7E23D3|nr:inactive phospholipase D5-like [Polyodon spathula]